MTLKNQSWCYRTYLLPESPMYTMYVCMYVCFKECSTILTLLICLPMASLAAGREVGVDEAERRAVEVERDRHSSLVPCNRQMCVLYTSDLEYIDSSSTC